VNLTAGVWPRRHGIKAQGQWDHAVAARTNRKVVLEIIEDLDRKWLLGGTAMLSQRKKPADPETAQLNREIDHASVRLLRQRQA
jgi:hypothetical protein